MQEGILIGSYSKPNQPGIYINDKQIRTFNPSYLLLNGSYLYAVSEGDDGQVLCFEFFGAYKLSAQLSTQGRDPCHIAIDRTKRFLFVANYSSGSVAVYLLDGNGVLVKMINFLVHEGHSNVVKDRQEAPHPHCSLASYDNKVFYIADLGTDYIYWYDFDAQYSTIKINNDKSLKLSGYGPRHLSLGAQADNLLFLAAELNQKVVILSNKGTLQFLSQITTSNNPQTFLSEIKYFKKAAQQFVAVASRGDNELIIYQLQKTQQSPNLKESTRKKVYNWPRHFNLNATLEKVLVANQRDAIVSEYSYNNGELTQIRKIPIETPSYVQYI